MTQKQTPSVKDLKPAKTEEKTPRVSKRQLSEEDFEQYVKILSDGQPHKIKDLLDTFKLPHTNAGRERLRAANRRINKADLGQVVGVFPDNENGKHFLFQPVNGNGK